VDTQELKQEYKRRRDDLTRRQNENDLVHRQMKEARVKLNKLAEQLLVIRDAHEKLEGLANSRRGAMKGKIESVVTEAVRLIYGPEYRVELAYAVKNNRSSLEIEMVRDTAAGAVRRKLGGFGGGLADTISVPLRLMVLLGSAQSARVCVLDECYKHMDEGRVELVAEFLKSLSTKLRMQVILCTHWDVIRAAADRAFVVGEKDGRSSVSG
jgi:chromosome segregation ATPase